jgi:hypothetical protein
VLYAAIDNESIPFGDTLLFIKRDRATYHHLCDQYYGINIHVDGRLFVLNDVFSHSPRAVELLSNSPFVMCG